MEGIRILVIEDDPVTSDVLKTFFEGNGATVQVADDGMQGIKLFKEQPPDLVLLDLMLPGLDGLDVLSLINHQQVPVIAITAKDDVDDIVAGLNQGLADYITKPFHLREVLARTQKALAQHQSEDQQQIQLGDLAIDDSKKEVSFKGQPITLTKKEYMLLYEMAQQPGHVFSERALVDKVWTESTLATAADVKRYIHLLRQKIEPDPSNPTYIVTVRGFGYKLEISPA